MKSNLYMNFMRLGRNLQNYDWHNLSLNFSKIFSIMP